MSLLSRVRSGVPDEIVGPDANPYMLRWFLFRRPGWPNIYLHKFVRSDDDRALHDHPWDFVSLILKGSYLEHTDGAVTRRRAVTVGYRKAEVAHRIELDTQERWVPTLTGIDIQLREAPVWTLVITGRKRREWGFWCPQGWRHWRDFVGVRGCE